MNEIALANRAVDWRRLKALVLDSVSSPITKRVYNLGLDEFYAWFAQEPRAGFTKATVSAWRVALEARGLGSVSINVRITAVRKLAVEAADNGLLAPELAVGITRVKGAKSIGVRTMHEATEQWKQTGKPARVFSEFGYQTRKTAKKGGWDRQRRVAAKAEHIDGKENPRFVVTSLRSEEWAAPALYEKLYCARGDMENRIKEQFSLFADRVSTETMRANQMRLYLSTMAYVLMSGLRRLGLKATELAGAQVSTIRTKLLKIGAQIRVTVRKVWVSMASSYPWQDLYQQVWTNLRC